MSDSVRPHRRQPTRLPRPRDSPGKNIGVGCHFFLQCMKMKSESEVAQSCPTLSDPMDCSLPGSSVHGISQARVLERGAIALFIWLYLESYTKVTGVRPWMKTTEVSPEPRSPLELTEPHCNHCQKSFWFLEASSLTPYCTKIPTQVGEESMATHSSILVWRILMDRVAWWATVHRVT